MKLARLKQAKDEAEKDVALYRSHMETEYQNKISEVILMDSSPQFHLYNIIVGIVINDDSQSMILHYLLHVSSHFGCNLCRQVEAREIQGRSLKRKLKLRLES